jgi:hypothetical protein
MRLAISIGVAVAALAVTASAQDTTVKSRTKITADDAQVMTISGCVRQDALTGTYSLVGGSMTAGDDLKTKSKVKTDVDKDDVTVKGKTSTKVDDGAVATSGVVSTYTLVPRSGVDLSAHVGHRVQVSAIAVDRGEGDADVKIKNKTTVDPDHASDTTTRTKTKVEVPKTAFGAYSVVAVNPLSGVCPAL